MALLMPSPVARKVPCSKVRLGGFVVVVTGILTADWPLYFGGQLHGTSVV